MGYFITGKCGDFQVIEIQLGPEVVIKFLDHNEIRPKFRITSEHICHFHNQLAELFITHTKLNNE